MKATRNIVVKSLFYPTLYTEFRDACDQDDVSQSKQLMNLAEGWLARRNDRRRSSKGEWPNVGQNRAMFPGRVRFGSGSMSMRM